jgi:beta-galactosidase
MIVNGTRVPLKGVCLHSDLGPLGMAFNRSAWQYRLQLLKDMGCNAIRGSHNPQDPALLDLFDEMGFYFIDEAFDEWKAPKNKNGYAPLFDQWAKKDLQAMIKRDRNHPSVIMYSIGNEVREQSNPKGADIAAFLTAICHQTDSTRPVTAAFNNWKAAISNGLADAVDIPGWNYKPDYYSEIHEAHPHWMVYGSETVSTVSSRGAYELPAVMARMKTRADHQSSSYDLEYCSWSQLPDMEWKCQEENPFVAGEFVWTGFDYLGEPTPYGSEWTSRSSYFGIIDLCGIPKDRYYLYQSHWSKNKVLHLLPHWNWEGKEGNAVPVYVYTNYPAAEIFINGKSYGRKSFEADSLLDRYRLRWNNTKYEPGTLKVIAYDSLGLPADSQFVHTAGKAEKILLQTNQSGIKANGEDVTFVTVSITDKNGNICPLANNLVKFEVSGAASIKAVDNGNPGNMRSFASRQVNAFNGRCMLILQSNEKEGSSSGLNDATLELKAFSHP